MSTPENRARNREKIAARKAEYRARNREKIAARNAEYGARRLAEFRRLRLLTAAGGLVAK
jgi:hypothetical protein